MSTSITADGSGAPWAGLLFNEDFSVVVGNTGIFRYIVAASAPLRSYQLSGSAFATALQANKKVWTNGNKLLVLSWANSAGNNYDYTIRAFNLEGSPLAYAPVGAAITGSYLLTGSAAPPSLSVS